MVIDDLVSTALLGTRGVPVTLPSLPQDLAAALPCDSGDGESQLLDAAASATLYARAGVKPRRDIALPEPSASDIVPECSPRAADILAQIFQDGLQPLLIEWLELAAASKLRPPSRLLPKLLEAAAAKRALQPAVIDVIDQRGRWLMQFNSRWQFANPSNEPGDDAWQVGNRQQRLEALRTVRASNPSKARELIAATWKDDAAEERTEWVGCLLIGLNDDDEEFLETCLDDRSSRVRETAADLLARLPNSKLVQRMIQRVARVVSFNPGSTGSLLKLKRSSKASLEVTLPEAFDKSLLRDGMIEKPNESLGPKQWWLLQMIACVPLDYWTQTYGAAATALVEAAPEEYAAVLVRAWLGALARRPVIEWIEPLLAAAAPNIRMEPTVLQAIPASQRAQVLVAILRGQKQPAIELNQIINAWRPLDETVSQMILDGFDLRIVLGCDTYFYLHPRTLHQLEHQITQRADASEVQRRSEQALSVITLRRELHKEFAR